MTQTQNQPESATQHATDELAHLHKMSKTAGLATQEYVAINVTAVFALIFGLASGLALIDNILLAVPLVGIVFAIVALRQITSSAGTQTGKGLAILGLVLALGFGGFVVVREATETTRTRADREAIDALIKDLGGNIRERRFDDAYQQFTPRFHERVTPEAFTERMKQVQGSPVYGDLNEVTSNGLFNFQSDPTTRIRQALTVLEFEFEKTEQPYTIQAVLRKTGDRWQFEDFMDFFPTANQAQGAQ